MSATQPKIMIYGANGYTGNLIAHLAKEQKLNTVLAGRNANAVNQMGESLGFACQVFGLDNIDEVVNQLKDIALVIHCAGPFSATAKPMMQACLQSQTHYTDITGEISVFELAHSLSKQAKQANVILCPGVGFDVIPTDCLASQLKEKMPDATHLAMAFDSAGKMSPGTAKTSVEGLATGGKIRKDGKIIKVPLAYKSKKIDFGQGEKHAITIPWGDVATAYYSTGIPNVEIYLPISPGRAKQMKRMNWFRWIFKLGFVQNRLKQNMAKASKGPDDEQRKTLKTLLWGEARNAKGETITSRLETANGYELTAHGALLMAKHILDSKVDGGYYTPSLLAGNKIVHQITGSGETVFK